MGLLLVGAVVLVNMQYDKVLKDDVQCPNAADKPAGMADFPSNCGGSTQGIWVLRVVCLLFLVL